jgi:iron complex transport system substrate-binding protein
MKRNFANIFTVLLTAMLILSGCSQPNNNPTQGDGYPYTFTDDAGRSVTIFAQPERIISFAPAHTETLFALELDAEVVGVDDWSNYPAETQDLTKVGDTFAPNFEVIMNLEPDLVITVGTAETPLVIRLDELGIPVVVLQATSLADILSDMETIGKICGKQTEAESLVAGLQNRITAVAEKIDEIPEEERVTVFYEVSPPGVWGLWTIGPDSFIHDLIATAGGVSVSGDTPGDYFGYSEEVLLEKDPDIIITPNPDTPAELAAGTRNNWNRIAAVRAGRVYYVDTDQVSRPGPRIVNILEQIAQALYPEQF